MNEWSLIPSFFGYENGGPQRGRVLSKVTQPVTGKVGPSPRPQTSMSAFQSMIRWKMC